MVTLTRCKDKQICLAMKDTGIGIRPEDQSKVFERFFRGDQARSQSGSGLGLSLAKAIARAHGGDIQVQSTLDQGSTFTVTFPTVDFDHWNITKQ